MCDTSTGGGKAPTNVMNIDLSCSPLVTSTVPGPTVRWVSLGNEGSSQCELDDTGVKCNRAPFRSTSTKPGIGEIYARYEDSNGTAQQCPLHLRNDNSTLSTLRLLLLWLPEDNHVSMKRDGKSPKNLLEWQSFCRGMEVDFVILVKSSKLS